MTPSQSFKPFTLGIPLSVTQDIVLLYPVVCESKGGLCDSVLYDTPSSFCLNTTFIVRTVEADPECATSALGDILYELHLAVSLISGRVFLVLVFTYFR